MSARLSKAKKAELGPQAVDMSARGCSTRAIACELGVNRNTVSKLIDDELAYRAEHRDNDVERHLSVYDRAQREAWEVYEAADTRSQNKVASLNAIIAAENSKVRLTGAEQAKKLEHSGPGGGPIEHEVVDARDELRERLSRFATSEPAGE